MEAATLLPRRVFRPWHQHPSFAVHPLTLWQKTTWGVQYRKGESLPLGRRRCAVSTYPSCGGTPQRPWKRSGADDALYPAGPDGPAPEGAVALSIGPRTHSDPARMAAMAACERRPAPPFGLPGIWQAISRLCQGALFLFGRSRWPLARWLATVLESESLAASAVTVPKPEGVAPGRSVRGDRPWHLSAHVALP